MERPQEIINPTTQMLGDFMEIGFLEQFVNRAKHRLDGKDPTFFTTQSLETKIPFLQMLQSVESPEKTSWEVEMENQIQAMEQFEKSCITTITHDPDSSEMQKSAPLIGREKRKRKRVVKASRNSEEVENQRMTHIAVERNRRRQMNDHLSSLRSLMPASYVHRGDQASIVGGAINFVKELEQHLQTLQASKRLQTFSESPSINNSSSLSDPMTPCSTDNGGKSGGNKAEIRSGVADIEVIVIQTHVNLKIQCVGRHGQLLKLIVAFDDLRFTVLHLNITSFESSVFYSFNLKIDEGCNIESADKIAKSVHEILNYINNGC